MIWNLFFIFMQIQLIFTRWRKVLLLAQLTQDSTEIPVWVLSCEPGFEYALQLACQNCHCRFTNQVERKFETYFLQLFMSVGDPVDCKTVRIFAYSRTREQSNKWSGTRLKTESETGERRSRPIACVRLLRHVLPISLLILRKQPTVLQSRGPE